MAGQESGAAVGVEASKAIVVLFLVESTMKLGLRSNEKELLQKTRQLFLDTKTDFLRRFDEAPDLSADVVALRESVRKGFDYLIEGVLCEIASADGPISKVEADVLNLLLGKQKTKIYYNELLKGGSDITQTFGTVIDVAIQLSGIENSNDYDPQNDPVLKCIETLGLAVVSADDDVNQHELTCLSKFTAILHSKAAAFDRRLQSLKDDPSTSESPTKALVTQVGANAPSVTLEQCVTELHALVGLVSVKREVETLINLARVFSLRKENGLPVPDMSFHMVFSGNPGTGKTIVARIVAKVYGCLGLLKKGHLVEVDRSGLVGNFVGQTATKTKKIIDQAKGGILFIDEAYALAKESENDYGQEAIEVVLKSMEDYRDDLVIIAAGYADRMAKFLGSNPGLRSRFPRVVSFPDYSTEELEEIFRRVASHSGYRIAGEAETVLKGEMERLWQQRGPDFANARDVRNLFERVVAMQANRVGGSSTITTEVLTTITEADVRLACTIG